MEKQPRSLLNDMIMHDDSFKNYVNPYLHSYKPKEKILSKGTKYPYFCFLIKGTARVVLSDEVEKSLHPVIWDITLYEVFGAMGLFDDSPANADVIAVTDVEIIEIDKKSFLEFINTDTQTGVKILTELTQTYVKKLAKMNERVLTILQQYLKTKK